MNDNTAVEGLFGRKRLTPLDTLFQRLTTVYKIAFVIVGTVWLASFIGLFLIVG